MKREDTWSMGRVLHEIDNGSGRVGESCLNGAVPNAGNRL